MKKYIVILAAIILLIFVGCGTLKGQIMDGDGMVNSYYQISEDEAKAMMDIDDGHVILDVRRQDEYDG